jgi:hypothetical protein
MPLHLVTRFKLHLVLFLLLLSTYFGKSVFRPYPLAGDEPSYLMDAISMGLFGNRQVRPLYADPSIVTSIYPSPVLSPDIIGNTNVTFHGVGLAILLIPAVFFTGKVLLAKLIVSIIAAISITILFDLSRKMVDQRHEKIVFTSYLLLGVSAPILFNANLLYPEYACTAILAGVLSVFYYKSRKKQFPSTLSIIFSSLFLSFLFWLNTRYLPLAIATQISLCIFLYSQKKKFKSEKLNSRILISASLFIASLAAMSLFYKSWYGTYNVAFVSQIHSSGLRIGDFAAVYRATGTYLFGHTEGLIPWAPFLASAVPGIGLLWRAYGMNIFYVLLPALIYLGTCVQAAAHGGSTPPAHYLAPIVPFMGLAFSLFVVTHYQKFGPRTFAASIDDVKQKVKGSKQKLIRMCAICIATILVTVWSLLLSLQGTIRQGDTYIRSASQEAPILPLARVGVSFWPKYLSPNRDNGSLGVPETEKWVQGSDELWRTGLSQGYRSSGAYMAEVTVKSKTEAISNLVLAIKERAGDGLTLIVERKYEILPNETVKVEIPFQLYTTNEVAWFFEASNAQGIEIVSSNLTVVGPERPSGYSDLGYTVLLMILFSTIYARQIRVKREVLPRAN